MNIIEEYVTSYSNGRERRNFVSTIVNDKVMSFVPTDKIVELSGDIVFIRKQVWYWANNENYFVCAYHEEVRENGINKDL